MLGFQFSQSFGNQAPRQFEECYSCFSMAVSGREDLESGDKILLPQSALSVLARMNVEYPMLFQLSNPSMDRRTHCGVCEFTAPEGRCSIPFWMMQNLMLAEGSLISVRNVSLPKATFVKFRPQSVDFLEISNPRVVLENNLRKYTCATTGDQILINYLGKNIYLDIVEVRPGGAASIVETDMEVDFEAPVGYKPPAPPDAAAVAKAQTAPAAPRELQKARKDDPAAAEADTAGFKPFTGNAKRLDGKASSASSVGSPQAFSESKESAPSRAAAAAAARAAAAPAAAPSTSETEVAPTRQSLVGNKYSKKKAAVSAFGGKGQKLG
jgi:ubiquitin fusion degradation protein 1